MKALWTSIAVTVVLLVIWSVFIGYADVDVDKMVTDIDVAVASIEADDWTQAQDAVTRVSRRWQDRRLVYSLFFDAISISDVESSLVRAGAYCRTHDESSAIAELSDLRHLLLFLYENELVTIENIL
ncbi:MAG: DUF4363 family protein [Anaerovoracaceae bacterium]|jgi:hypothetical protein